MSGGVAAQAVGDGEQLYSLCMRRILVVLSGQAGRWS